MGSFFKKSEPEQLSEQAMGEIVLDTRLVHMVTRNTKVNYLSSAIVWREGGDFKYYRARVDLGSNQEIIFELGWGKGEGRMSLARLFLNISTSFADFQIAEPAFVGLPVRRRYRHEYDQQLAEALQSLSSAIHQQMASRNEQGEKAEGRKRAREFCLDRLLP